MALDEAPPFWWGKPGWQAALMWPASFLFGRASARRMDSQPGHSVEVPVICVGNFIVGGAGKTPTTMLLAKHIRKRGMKPGILSRGYGGGITTATVVEPGKHNAHDVGDEALLHANITTTVISADRPSGADLLVAQGCDFIIMDDGFQNPSLHKDFCLVVVDSRRGLGNGFTMPAGPLRVPFGRQLLHVDAVLVIGDEDGASNVIRKVARAGKPVFHAEMRMIGKSKWAGKQVLAYAGIADPSKFFSMLEDAKVKVVDRQGYGDHHTFSEEDVEDLFDRANRQKLDIVTTSKDAARLKEMGDVQAKLLEASQIIEVDLIPEDSMQIERVLDIAIDRAEKRALAS